LHDVPEGQSEGSAQVRVQMDKPAPIERQIPALHSESSVQADPKG
jgi:hypothetical protein